MKATKKRQMRYAVSYMTHVMRLIVAECKGTGRVVSANSFLPEQILWHLKEAIKEGERANGLR